jgi:predicted HTH domain antitoxin
MEPAEIGGLNMSPCTASANLLATGAIRREMSSMTRIAVELPEDVAKRLESAWRDVSRGTLEAVALEAYRDGTLSREQVGRVLGLSFRETEAFLKERQAYLAYNEEDLQADLRDLGHLGGR